MKRIISYIGLAFAAALLCGCAKENLTGENFSDDTSVSVSLEMSAPGISLMVKALGELNTTDLINNGIWVAVYESGYRSEVVKATDLTLKSGSTNSFTFTVKLTLSDNARTLHFVSASSLTADSFPFEESAMGTLTTTNGVDAYWCRKSISGVTEDESKLKSELGNIVLVRNFAKVTLKGDCAAEQFVLESFKVFNTPSSGFIAAYTPANGFISGYETMSFDGACENYGGRIPSAASLQTWTNDDNFINVDATNQTGSEYFYERPAPDTKPTFIIIKGKYLGGTTSLYYKINLRDETGKYYAFLRNFEYKVKIKAINMPGYATVQEAVASAGSGDVMTSIEFQDMTNISDTEAQLFVTETSYTAVGETDIILGYKFVTDMENPTTSIKNNVVSTPISTAGVEIRLEDGDSFDTYTVGTDGSDGYRVVTIHTNAPNGVYKERKITFIGHYFTREDGKTVEKTIQRSVNIIVRPMLFLTASCDSKIDGVAGAPLDLTVGIESGLPASIFPIDLKINVTALSLVPVPNINQGLVAESGRSFDGLDKPTFYYVKSVSYDDYQAATTTSVEVEGKGTVNVQPILCKFLSNTDLSASDIWVTSELFNVASCSFTNLIYSRFTNVSTSNVVLGNNNAVVRFTMADTKPVTLNVTHGDGTTDTITYTPTTSGAQTVNVPLTFGASFSVTISAEQYRSETVSGQRTFAVNPSSAFQDFADLRQADNNATATMNIGFDTNENSTFSSIALTLGRTRSGDNYTYSIKNPTTKQTIVIPSDVVILNKDVEITFWSSYRSNRTTIICKATVSANTCATGTIRTLDFSKI